MKKTLLTLSLLCLAWSVSVAQVRLSTAYNYPTLPGSAQDSVLNGLKSIRGCAFAADVDGDGRSEIAVTNYNDLGRVHIFEAVGNDSMRLVWTSPRVTAGGGNSTPRYVMFGNLDGDNRQEVIFLSNTNGVMIFEWNGVVGSDNYGSTPSQVIGTPFISSSVTVSTEQFDIGDVDGDGQQELLIPINAAGTADDKFYVISAIGDWSTGDPGFSSFSVEFERARGALSSWGLNNGGPQAMMAVNLDGTGNKEILLQTWDNKTVTPVRVTSANTFLMADTSTGRAFRKLGAGADDVALFGGLAYDIDGDGREEVYLPTYPTPAGGPGAGIVHMISYNSGQNTAFLDSTNVTVLNTGAISGTKDLFGYGYGDINNNGKKELYFSTSYNTNVIALEFQGGDKRIPTNWIPRLVYRGDSTIYTAITYRDSVGRRDTIRTVDPSFVAKLYGRNTDFDRDGREDIILPYQALSDSVSVRRLVWNAGASRFDTTSNIRELNPKRWGLRIIERDPSQGVEGKDFTIITPDDYRLEQNYPNPFNPSTTIGFYLPIRDKISLKVYDILGKEVRTLINNESREAGVGTVVWDGKDNLGKAAATGTYFYSLRFGNFEKTNKMLLVK